MKAFSTHTLALASLVLLSACSGQQASVLDMEESGEAVSSIPEGPYLEIEEDESESVELHIGSSSSSVSSSSVQ